MIHTRSVFTGPTTLVKVRVPHHGQGQPVVPDTTCAEVSKEPEVRGDGPMMLDSGRSLEA